MIFGTADTTCREGFPSAFIVPPSNVEEILTNIHFSYAPPPPPANTKNIIEVLIVEGSAEVSLILSEVETGVTQSNGDIYRGYNDSHGAVINLHEGERIGSPFKRCRAIHQTFSDNTLPIIPTPVQNYNSEQVDQPKTIGPVSIVTETSLLEPDLLEPLVKTPIDKSCATPKMVSHAVEMKVLNSPSQRLHPTPRKTSPSKIPIPTISTPRIVLAPLDQLSTATQSKLTFTFPRSPEMSQSTQELMHCTRIILDALRSCDCKPGAETPSLKIMKNFVRQNITMLPHFERIAMQHFYVTGTNPNKNLANFYIKHAVKKFYKDMVLMSRVMSSCEFCLRVLLSLFTDYQCVILCLGSIVHKLGKKLQGIRHYIHKDSGDGSINISAASNSNNNMHTQTQRSIQRRLPYTAKKSGTAAPKNTRNNIGNSLHQGIVRKQPVPHFVTNISRKAVK